MKIAVVGSRTFSDRQNLYDVLSQYQKIDLIISGGANGADKIAEAYAKDKGIKTKIFLPDWAKYGNSAGIIRNKLIVESCDLLIAFWDGESKGTRFSIDYAKKINKDWRVIHLNPIL